MQTTAVTMRSTVTYTIALDNDGFVPTLTRNNNISSGTVIIHVAASTSIEKVNKLSLKII